MGRCLSASIGVANKKKTAVGQIRCGAADGHRPYHPHIYLSLNLTFNFITFNFFGQIYNFFPVLRRFISLDESVIPAEDYLKDLGDFKILAAQGIRVNSGRNLAKSQDILIFQKHSQMSQFPFESAMALIDTSTNYTRAAPWGPRSPSSVSSTFLTTMATDSLEIVRNQREK